MDAAQTMSERAEERRDPREDESWDGPTPRYAVVATVDPDEPSEGVQIYLAHTIAQLIDASIDAGKPDFLSFPAGSDWDRDWSTISALGMTEAEVSLILSGTDEREMLGVTNMAMGLAVNQLIEREGPVFFASVAGIAASILSRKGIPPA